MTSARNFPEAPPGPTPADPVALPDGGHDLYIEQTKFRKQFAGDLPLKEAKRMAASQRPVAEAAPKEPAGEPAWETIRRSLCTATHKNIPPKALKWMAERAKSKVTVVVKGGSHVAMVSHPDIVAVLTEKAAKAASN
ncbi:alpha/beta fold hydrolase [Sinorhizobium medicae]